MQCPRCQQKVVLHINQCPNCQQTLKPLILSQQIALSTQQRQALLNKILLPSSGLLAVVGLIAILSVAIKPVPVWTWLAVGLMIAATSFYLFRLARDWMSGHVQLQIDQLELLQTSTDRTGKHFYGTFGTIGKQQLQASHYERAIEGNYYLVTYSPQSKIVWELALVTREPA